MKKGEIEPGEEIGAREGEKVNREERERADVDSNG